MYDESNVSAQVEYLGRYVDKNSFCAFVYNNEGEKLAKSWEEYQNMVGSGLWHPTKELALACKKEEKKEEVKPQRKSKFYVENANDSLAKEKSDGSNG